MARICLTPSPQETTSSSRRPGTKRPGAPASALCSMLAQLPPASAIALAAEKGPRDCEPFACRRRCVMSAGAARRLRCQHHTTFFFFLLPLLVGSMAQGGGHQQPAHVGEDRGQIDGGEHAEEEEQQQQQLSRLGSRPPRCDHKCGACAPCKPVQVSAGAAAEQRRPRPLGANYEPVGWKCRCGAAVFDP